MPVAEVGPQVTPRLRARYQWEVPLAFDRWLEPLTELRESPVFTTLLEGRTGQGKASTRGGLGGTRAQDHRSPWTWLAPLSRNVGVFAHPEAPPAAVLLGLDGGFLVWA